MGFIGWNDEIKSVTMTIQECARIQTDKTILYSCKLYKVEWVGRHDGVDFGYQDITRLFLK